MVEGYSGKAMGNKIYRSLIFFVPLLYSIQTRFLRRTSLGIIVWITEYLTPVLIAMVVLDLHHINIIHGLISIIAVYNLYEIGYIQNDCETTKHEERPTLRLSYNALNFYESYKISIYLMRLVIGCFLSYYMMMVGISMSGLIVMWAIIPYYLIYNKLRGRINLYLIALLTTYRYCFPIYLYGLHTTQYLWVIIICMFFSYPFPTFIEICSDGKGNPPESWTRCFLKNFEDRFIFRVKYYVALGLLITLMAFFEVVPLLIVVIPLYYLLDRTPQVGMKKINKR